LSRFQSAVSPLLEGFLKNRAVCTDSRAVVPKSIFFALSGPNFNGNEFAIEALEKGASLSIVDDPLLEGIAGIRVVENSLEALQWLAHSYRKTLKGKVLAIGGSNGKTTTKGLISSVSKKKYKTFSTPGNYNNHIGVPLTILKCPRESELIILEMGANHIGEHTGLLKIAEPELILVTNIGKDHLEGFGGIEGVIRSTSEFFDYGEERDIPVLFNPDYPGFEGISKNGIPFGATSGSRFRGELLMSKMGIVVKAYDPEKQFVSQLHGEFNFGNIMAAISIGRYLDIDDELIYDGICEFEAESNRSQVMEKGGLTIFLDCYNANPTSMKLALESLIKEFSSPHSLVLGGMKELGDYSEKEHRALIEVIKSKNLQKVFLVGKEFEFLDSNENLLFFSDLESLKAQWKEICPGSGSLLVKGSRYYNLEKLFE
jgi:UDP-N-acetylmuramoyl-tripeptide--D-alanyl-D-alanine ligase